MSDPAKQEPPKETKREAKMVKIKLLRDAVIGDKIANAGTVCMVDEETAKELCDKGFEGYMPFYGNRPEMVMTPGEHNPLDRKKIFRAERVS